MPSLSATLSDPFNIDLSWKIDATAISDFFGGYIIEYTNRSEDPFIILDVFPPDIRMARHPDLAPETPFIYRVRPFFGKPSAIVEITTGKAKDEDSANAAESVTTEMGKGGRESLKDSATIAAAGPSELTASLKSPRVVRLTWNDRSRDEDGYFLEVSVDNDSHFKVVSYFEPDTIACEVPMLPSERRIYFRLWAFFYGKPSILAEQTTGIDPIDHRTAQGTEPPVMPTTK